MYAYWQHKVAARQQLWKNAAKSRILKKCISWIL